MRLEQDELDEADEEVKDFLEDKDRFMNSCQNHHGRTSTPSTPRRRQCQRRRRGGTETEVENCEGMAGDQEPRSACAEMLAMRKQYRGEIEEYLEGGGSGRIATRFVVNRLAKVESNARSGGGAGGVRGGVLGVSAPSA